MPATPMRSRVCKRLEFIGLFTMPTARLPRGDYRLVAPLAVDGQGNLYSTTWLRRKKEVAAAAGTMETKIQSESCVPGGSGRI